ncbi:MAG: LLM class flavin-dependent oxidoreductase [Gammaproteobacteria bacterium]|nr:LLM class flavin-dependent oxidoreductase [Gammaproteobacteria bacterium]
MRFSISVNMQRVGADHPMESVVAQALELVRMAEQGGFDIAWAAEHHCVELTIAPNPFLILTHWAAHTQRIRLGTAVVVAPYWHPIRLAGEIGLTDLYCGGRLELGLGRGAFQYEFDRMAGGIPQEQGGEYLREMLPALQGLWRGDYAHEGEHWRFPRATALPKPVQQPHPPLWVAARGPDTFEWAIEHGIDVMSTPLHKPFSEVEALAGRLRETLGRHPGARRPRFLVLRRTCVYENADEWREVAKTERRYARRFDGLFHTAGEVRDGFPQPIPGRDGAIDDDTLAEIRTNMMFGTPDEVVEKLHRYEAAGVDMFCYGANFDLPHERARRSLELFIERVMPHFAGAR